MIGVWHFDDLKVLHENSFEVNKFAQYLLTIYGNKIKVRILMINDYIVIYLDYSETVAVKF